MRTESSVPLVGAPRADRTSGSRRPPDPLLRPRHVYEKGRLRIDFDAYEVFVDGQQVFPFLREFELLRFLVKFPNRVFDRSEIISSVWGDDADVDPRTIDVHVRRLRTWIERDAAHPELIVTVRGVGYKFDDRALLAAAADAVDSPRAGTDVATTPATSKPSPSRAATTSSIRRSPRRSSTRSG